MLLPDRTKVVLIDKAIDFIASTQAFMEYLNKDQLSDDFTREIPPERMGFYESRLAWYRSIYHPEGAPDRQEAREEEDVE